MTTPSAWRFQWPDGTWIEWNPETEQWEKQSASPGDTPEVVDAPLQAPIEIARDRDAVDEEPSLDQTPADDELHDFEEPDEELDDELDEPDDDDDEGSRRRARPAETVFAAPGDERPERPLMPTILGGAAIGLVVGIVVTILIR
jgi:hypothetical protein